MKNKIEDLQKEKKHKIDEEDIREQEIFDRDDNLLDKDARIIGKGSSFKIKIDKFIQF